MVNSVDPEWDRWLSPFLNVAKLAMTVVIASTAATFMVDFRAALSPYWLDSPGIGLVVLLAMTFIQWRYFHARAAGQPASLGGGAVVQVESPWLLKRAIDVLLLVLSMSQFILGPLLAWRALSA
jgi:hypothetical protein